jgi:NTP pyrophosphatase (non-canonical NTP hydrolase)
MPTKAQYQKQKILTMRDAQAFVKFFAEASFKATGDDRWRDYPNVDKFDHLHEELIEMSRKLRYRSKKERIQIIKAEKEVFVDGIGDLFFALCRLANQLNIDIEEAFESVHQSIFDRYSKKSK